MSTNRTRDLSDDLLPWVGMTLDIRDIAYVMSRLGRSYARIQERWASEEMDDATTERLTEREDRLEAKLVDLAGDLPLPTIGDHTGTWAVRFEGDPRAYTVRLVVMDGQTVVSEVGVDR